MAEPTAISDTDRCPQSKRPPTTEQFRARFSMGAHRAVTCTCGARVYVHPRRLDWSHAWHTYLAEHDRGVDNGRSDPA